MKSLENAGPVYEVFVVAVSCSKKCGLYVGRERIRGWWSVKIRREHVIALERFFRIYFTKGIM
jgi:hypothetical protein